MNLFGILLIGGCLLFVVRSGIASDKKMERILKSKADDEPTYEVIDHVSFEEFSKMMRDTDLKKDFELGK